MMYSLLYRLIKHYLKKGGKGIRRTLRELETEQWLPRAELEEIQLAKIQRLVSYAYEHVPFYRERYRSEGIHPQDIRSFKDFQALPFLTRDDVNKNLDSLISKVYRGRTYVDITGGSTGKPMRFIMDRASLLDGYCVETRCRSWYGVRPGDKMAWVWGQEKDFPKWSFKNRLGAGMRRRRFLNSRTMNEPSMRAFAEMLVSWRPDMFRSYPSALSMFARSVQKTDITGIRPKLVEIGGEAMTQEQRQLFEEVFRAPVANYYGAWELGVIAYECPLGNTHVIENRYLELVSDDKTVSPGQMGEIVITSLNQYAMPLIRYKIEDMGIYDSNGCSCGRGMPVLREIAGRKSDMFVKPDGQAIHWSSVSKIFLKHIPGLYQYQIYQPDRQHIEVRLVCEHKIDSACRNNILNSIQLYFGETMDISVKMVDHIEPTPSGKLRFIISDAKPDST